MKIVFLVINYMPHQLVSIESVIKNFGAEVFAFNYKDDHTVPKGIRNLNTFRVKQFTKSEFKEKIIGINPHIMVVAGWVVKDFVWVSKIIKKELNIPIVSYSDTQWRNTWRQRANAILSPFHLKKAFSHIWVAGFYQYEYARKLGFSNQKIIYNSLSCDVHFFKEVSIEEKIKNYPKNFLFVGRFAEVKGLDMLVSAWNDIQDKKGWRLTFIGEGELKKNFKNVPDLTIKEFTPHHLLIQEFKNAGIFILPSVFEQWSLIIHEAAAAGLPVIATETCGASPHFVINNYSGFRVEPNSGSIKKAILQCMELDEKTLIKYSKNSRKLANTITPELGAAQLLSVLNK